MSFNALPSSVKLACLRSFSNLRCLTTAAWLPSCRLGGRGGRVEPLGETPFKAGWDRGLLPRYKSVNCCKQEM